MSMVTAALIGGAATLLGGMFSRKSAKKATARQNAYNSPINIRARAEEGGFNPLLWAGTGNIQAQPTSSGMMGNAIANAGLYAADSMKDQEALEIEKSRLAMDRERLDELLQQNTIRPKKGGIYSGNQKTPSSGGVGSPDLPSDYTLNPAPPILESSLESTVEKPREFEADVYGAALTGDLKNWAGDLFNLNFMKDGAARNFERSLERSPLGEKWRLDEKKRKREEAERNRKPRRYPNFKPSGSPKGYEIFGARINKM